MKILCSSIVLVLLIGAALMIGKYTPLFKGTESSDSAPEEQHTTTLSSADDSMDSPGTHKKVAKPVEKPIVLPDKLYIDPEEADKYDLLKNLNQPDSSIQKDLEVVKALFTQYRLAFKENPIGSHREIVSVLAGGNPQKVPYINIAHPALQGNRLYDRWGTPFYFHQITGKIMEVRSAGPDKRHWNQDDVVIR